MLEAWAAVYRVRLIIFLEPGANSMQQEASPLEVIILVNLNYQKLIGRHIADTLCMPSSMLTFQQGAL